MEGTLASEEKGADEAIIALRESITIPKLLGCAFNTSEIEQCYIDSATVLIYEVMKLYPHPK